MLVADGRLEPDGRRRIGRSATSATLAVPETLTALIAARLDAPRPTDRALVAGRGGPGPELHARRTGRGRRRRPRPTSSRACAAWSGASCSSSTPTRGRPSAASTASSRRSSARSPTTRWPSATARTRHLAAARYFEALGDRRARRRAGGPLPRGATQRRRDGPEADALAARRGSPCAPPRNAPPRSAPTTRRSRSSSRRWRSRPIPPSRRTCSIRTGEAASLAGRHTRAQEVLRDAITRKRGAGDRAGAAAATAALGRALLDTYRTDDALAVLEPAAVEFEDLADLPPGSRCAPARPRVLLRWGFCRGYQGHGPGAAELRARRSGRADRRHADHERHVPRGDRPGPRGSRRDPGRRRHR